MIILSVFDSSDVKLIQHWQVTLLIIHSACFVCKIFFDIAILSMQDWQLSAGVMLGLGIFTYTFAKNYLDEYVHLEKI